MIVFLNCAIIVDEITRMFPVIQILHDGGSKWYDSKMLMENQVSSLKQVWVPPKALRELNVSLALIFSRLFLWLF